MLIANLRAWCSAATLPGKETEMSNRYSNIFDVTYEVREPGGAFPPFTQFMWIDPRNDYSAHPFAIVWDEDFDERAVLFAELMSELGWIRHIDAIAESQGGVEIFVRGVDPVDVEYAANHALTDHFNDHWSVSVRQISVCRGVDYGSRVFDAFIDEFKNANSEVYNWRAALVANMISLREPPVGGRHRILRYDTLGKW